MPKYIAVITRPDKKKSLLGFRVYDNSSMCNDEIISIITGLNENELKASRETTIKSKLKGYVPIYQETGIVIHEKQSKKPAAKSGAKRKAPTKNSAGRVTRRTRTKRD